MSLSFIFKMEDFRIKLRIGNNHFTCPVTSGIFGNKIQITLSTKRQHSLTIKLSQREDDIEFKSIWGPSENSFVLKLLFNIAKKA